jgi:ComF family protein
LGKAAAEAIFPARCLACGELIASAPPAADKIEPGSDGTANLSRRILTPFTCRRCRIGIQAVGSPICEHCGQVFAARAGDDHICGSCIRAPNHFQTARSALLYTGQCASLVHALKYSGKVQLARPFGMILRRSSETFWPGADFDLIVPVPLHRRRLKARGFNQVGLMMRQWARSLDNQMLSPAPAVFNWDVMERVLPTRPQTGLGRKDRPLNLRNAFGLKSGAEISGMRLLVLDDVYTTGATANEAARVLMKHGAARVDVLTLARAV